MCIFVEFLRFEIFIAAERRSGNSAVLYTKNWYKVSEKKKNKTEMRRRKLGPKNHLVQAIIKDFSPSFYNP